MAYRFKHGDRPVDGYTIQRAVGSGGFGEVYYAISDGGREVALKYLRDNPHVELRGISHCINLKSPHLVSIFDVRKSADDEYFVVMEYCSGPSLRDLLIAEPNGFSSEKAAFFVREIGKGLAYLHDRGIVHRDLKPGNIFFDDGYVKIGDYGLSKFISVSRHSGQTASVGTVHYMAPEIGSGNYSRGVDIYALGVILYEMLLGKVPFEGSTMAEVLMKHLVSQPRMDELPEPFAQVIRKALEKDPKDRYQLVDDMVNEMLSGEVVQKSLAGFSPASLSGAVRHGAADRAASPIPSPNPAPRRHSPQADTQSGIPLPDHLNRRIDRIGRRIDQKIAKLGGKKSAPKKSRTPRGKFDDEPLEPTPPPETGRKRRIIIALALAISASIGIGGLYGGMSNNEEVGVSAGMLIAALTGGVVLARKVIARLGTDAQPVWAQRAVSIGCSAPLAFIAAAPMIDKFDEKGVIIALATIIVAAFGDWSTDVDYGRSGELSFGTAAWKGFGGFLATILMSAIFQANMDDWLFVVPGVVAASSLIIQATSWWLREGATTGAANASAPVTIGLPHKDRDERKFVMKVEAGIGRGSDDDSPGPESGSSVGIAGVPNAGDSPDARTDQETVPVPKGPYVVRGTIVRMFWAFVAFVFMCVPLVLATVALNFRGPRYNDITQIMVLCFGFAAAMGFALSKTTPMRRVGFWNETIRPFLISVALFGMASATTLFVRGVERGSKTEIRSYSFSHEDSFAGPKGLLPAHEIAKHLHEIASSACDENAFFTEMQAAEREQSASVREAGSIVAVHAPPPPVPPAPPAAPRPGTTFVASGKTDAKVKTMSALSLSACTMLFIALVVRRRRREHANKSFVIGS